MGLPAILASFLQLCFFLIEVFRSSKQGVKQIDHIYQYADTFPDLFREEPLIISLYRKVVAIRGRSQEGGGQYKGHYYNHLRKPSGEPSDTPQMVAGHVPEARACSIQFSSIPKASPPQGFVSLYNLSCSTFTPLQPPVYKVPSHLQLYIFLTT